MNVLLKQCGTALDVTPCSAKELMSWCPPSRLCSCWGSPRCRRVCQRSFCRQGGSKCLICCRLLDFCALYSTKRKESWKPFVQFGASHHQLLIAWWRHWGQIIRKQDLPATICFVPLFPYPFWFASKSFLWSQDDGWAPWISQKQATNLGVKLVL